MKVQVKDLRPNPYRKIDKYPILRDKVETLKTSISETTFWDNILARPGEGVFWEDNPFPDDTLHGCYATANDEEPFFEIAYGHHRLIALQELGLEEVDIPIRNLQDAQMIKIMANENLDEWKMNPAVYTETVLVAKEFLDGELAKHKTWEQVRSDAIFRPIFNSEPQFRSAKGKGVGRDTIKAFLGGSWSEWVIQDALSTIKAVEKDEISREAVNELPSTHHSQIFKREVKKHKIPKSEQVSLAKTIKRNVSKREMPGFIKKHVDTVRPKPKPPSKPKKIPTLDQYADEIMEMAYSLESKLAPIIPHINDFEFILTEKMFFGALKYLYKVVGDAIERESVKGIKMLKP